MKRFKRGFTLAEVLITLAIIGVVAAISIPSVISNSQQQEFKTGLRKAVSVLNSAITMNMAIDGESPYDNKSLPQYLMRHMSIMKTYSTMPFYASTHKNNGTVITTYDNGGFYTTDGMRYEFDRSNVASAGGNRLHESNVVACTSTNTFFTGVEFCEGCGSYGLGSNPNNTTKPPCLIMVDVNGDRKPTPMNVNCKNTQCEMENKYIVPLPSEKMVRDTFSILITEDRAVPYGVTAQKAMYQAQK